MYSDATPFIEPDMTQYHFLVHLKRVRDNLIKNDPDLQTKIDRLYDTPRVKLFLETALPEKNDAMSLVAISNAVAGRKMLIRELFEQLVNPEPNQPDIETLRGEIIDYSHRLGLDPDLANQAMDKTEKMATGYKLSLP